MNKSNLKNKQSSLIVVMGVSGSGKSYLASKVSTALAYDFIEADDFHSDEAKKNMAANIPLTDEVRQFWFEIICRHLKSRSEKNIVLAFSGLKYKHRQTLRSLMFNTQFIWLDGDQDVIKERLNNRKNHFVSSDFLSGQLKAMEPPVMNEHDVFKIDLANEIEDVFSQCLKIIDVNLTVINNTTKTKNRHTL